MENDIQPITPQPTSDPYIPPTTTESKAETNLNITPPVVPIEHHAKTNAVEIVWQWLCYGLWSWTLCSLSILLSSIMTYYLVDKSNDYDFTVYVLAALLCLLPLAFLANRVYSKKEPEQKHGFAAVVMVLNAVGIFLAALGSLITMVVTILSFVVNSSTSSTKQVVLISSSIVTLLGFMLFVRILNPIKIRKLVKKFPLFVLGLSIVALILTFLGPFKAEVVRRDDKLIENNLNDVSVAIQNYTSTNKKLPSSLSDIPIDASYQTDAKTLITRGLVTYTEQNNSSSDIKSTGLSKQYSYKLCVTYKTKKGTGTVDNSSVAKSYISTSSHPAGEQCYSQTTISYSYRSL